MSRVKIDYGIDLGTTNSAIARMEKGKAVIKKNEDFGHDTTPSAVTYTKKKAIKVGIDALSELKKESVKAFNERDSSLTNSFVEFKRTMGSKTSYKSKNMGKSYLSEDLSAEILKKMKLNCRDEIINSVVITIPAMFKGAQCDATKKASELAGFKHCVLLQEPIAASMAFAVGKEDNTGKWLVFDFGGGTFDVALLSSNDGVMKVEGTAGNNALGGKTIDFAIIDDIIIPHIQESYSIEKILSDEGDKEKFRNMFKQLAEQAKIKLSTVDEYELENDEYPCKDDDGNDIEISITITKNEYENVAKPIFQEAIDITEKLLKKKKIKGSELSTVLMIGGPTRSDILRSMIKESITENINISIDPMTAVATGASYYASTIDNPIQVETDSASTGTPADLSLQLMYETAQIDTEAKIGIKIKKRQETPLSLNIVRDDGGWESGTTQITDSEIFTVSLNKGTNSFTLLVTDDKANEITTSPNSFSMICGTSAPAAVLPRDICIEAVDSSSGKLLLLPIKGLSKEQTLKAKGTRIFKTTKQINPGKKSDRIEIPIFEGSPFTQRIHNPGLRGTIVITGEDLPGLLPKGNDMEITLKVGESFGIDAEITIPFLEDHFIEEKFETGSIEFPEKDALLKAITSAGKDINWIKEEYPDIDNSTLDKLREKLEKLRVKLNKGSANDEDFRGEIQEHLASICLDIEKEENKGKWPKAIGEINDALDALKKASDEYGNEDMNKILKLSEMKVKEVIEKQDLSMAKQLITEMRSIQFTLIREGAGPAFNISIIKGMDDDFDSMPWKDSAQAKQLINQAKGLINSNRGTTENLDPIVGQLYSLLPKLKKGRSTGGGGDIEG